MFVDFVVHKRSRIAQGELLLINQPALSLSLGSAVLFADFLEPGLDFGAGAVSLGDEFALGVVDFEMRDRFERVLLGDGGFPVDAFGAGAVDINFHNGEVVAFGVELVEFGRNAHAGRAAFACEIENSGFPINEVVGERDFCAFGNHGGVVGFFGCGGEGSDCERGKSEKRDGEFFHKVWDGLIGLIECQCYKCRQWKADVRLFVRRGINGRAARCFAVATILA